MKVQLDFVCDMQHRFAVYQFMKIIDSFSFASDIEYETNEKFGEIETIE